MARRNDVNANLVSTGGAGFASRLAGLAAWCRWLWSRRRWMLPRGMRRRRDGWRSRWPMAQAAASRPAGAQLDELEASATEDELAIGFFDLSKRYTGLPRTGGGGDHAGQEVCAPQAVPGAPAARARGGAGADVRLRVLRIGEAVEDRRGRDRDAGAITATKTMSTWTVAPLEGDPDGAREVHLIARRRSRRLKKKGLRSRIHRKSRRNKPLSEREKQGNKTRSSVRVRVEHVFGAQSNDMGGTLA